MMFELCEGSPEFGVEADAAALTDSRLGSQSQVGHHNVIAFPRLFELASTGFSWRYISKFSSLSKKYDLIHYHFPWPFMDFVHALLRIDTPYVVTYHSDIIRYKSLFAIYRPLMKKFLAGAAAVVATSEHYRETSPYLNHEATEVIPIGINERAVQPEKISTRIEDFASGKRKFFLSIGVYRHYKGFELLIEAATKFSGEIVFVSAGPNARLLQANIDKSKAKNVTLIDNASEFEKGVLLKNCTGFVFPSNNRAEAYGVALVEAAMAAKPMITCDVGTGTGFVNLDKVTGLVVPAKDEISMLQAMEVLNKDADTQSKYGENARQHYLAELTGSKMSQRYCELYHRVLNAAGKVQSSH